MNIILTGHYKKFFHNEFCFNSSSGGLHENNFIKFITLRDEFRNLGINLIADDSIDNHPNIDALIVHDHPTDINLLTSIANFRGPKYLTTEEAPFILPNSFSLDRSKEYRLVFTNYLNGDNFPVNFIFTIPNHIDIAAVESVRKNDLEISKKNKKVFVGTNKKPTEKEHINSNYSLRDSLLDWYSINEPNDFHLYGKNWDRVFLRSNSSLSKLFNYSKFDIIFRRLDKRFKSIYQGTLASKYQTLSKYKFQFCLENCIGFEGYMTEKIFDALICRNLPVYHPSTALSLDGILPNDIYINMYDFKSFGDLNRYLNSMSLNEYTDYILRIDHFIDDLPSIFEKNYWAKTVALNIVNDLKSLRMF